MTRFLRAGFALLFAVTYHDTLAEAANKLVINRQQPLASFSLRTVAPATLSPSESGVPSSERAALQFQAFGRNFNIELESNEHLTENLDVATRARVSAQLKIYRGRLAGNSASWVRINRIGEKLSGMFWDGKELFIIDPSEDIAAAATLDSRQKPQPMIYRLKDATLNARCALEPNLASLSDYDALVEELRGRAQALPQAQGEIALPAALKEISVAVVADPLFVQANSTDPQAAVVARMNVVDGIYSAQVGVQLKLASVLPLNANGTLTATAPSTLLGQFGTYSASGSFTNPGIAHLFTGRDLDGSTVGIAYLGSLCSSRFSVGVSQMVGVGTVGALIAAHEIGHNFGAPHDNQSGSACASTPSGFIMNPSVSSSANTFSSCSLSQMAPIVSAAACVRTGTGGGGGGGGTGATTISVTPTSAAAGNSVTVSWSGIVNASSTNWFGLYVPGAASQNHNGNWMYVSCSKTPGATRASGSCSFPLPSTLATGSYEMRLHASGSWTAIATSSRLTITGGSVGTGTTVSVSPGSIARGATATVSWSGITNLGATNWVGLYVPGAASQNHNGNWMYVSCSKTPTVARASGSCPFPIPATLAPGTYQMRLHAPSSWTAIAVSGPLIVQ